MATTQGKKHWTDNVHRNHRFEQELRALYPIRVTNVQAYQVYAEYHAQRKSYYEYALEKKEPPKVKLSRIATNEWLQMNVRNQLCKLEHIGVLERIEPGVYVWVPRKP